MSTAFHTFIEVLNKPTIVVHVNLRFPNEEYDNGLIELKKSQYREMESFIHWWFIFLKCN